MCSLYHIAQPFDCHNCTRAISQVGQQRLQPIPCRSHVTNSSISSPQDNSILSGQWTALHALQEYDYTSGKVVREIKYPNKDGAFLYAAQYLNPDLVFAGGSGTNKAEVIDIKTNEVRSHIDCLTCA